MKKKFNAARLAPAVMLSCALLMAGCSGTGSNTNTTTTTAAQPQSTSMLSFVAADKTNWDKEVNIGEYAYTLALEMFEDGTLTLSGTCKGRAVAQTRNGGPGGMGPGQQQEPATEAAEQTTLSASEMTAQNFEKTGTWELEEGYGYTVTIDGYTTKTDYDKPSARHILYAVIENNGASSDLIQFQGKDTGFRNTMAADYVEFEEREAVYIFSGNGVSGNGNASLMSMYLEEDGQANVSGSQGSSPYYYRGTWTENEDKSLTVSINGGDYTADYCDISGKEGYRITYNSMTMYTSVSGEKIDYTDVDFNGETVVTMLCGQGDYTLELTEKGFALLLENGASSKTGKYIQDGDEYTVTLEGNSFTSENGELTISFEKQANFSNTETVERTFLTDGSTPEKIENEGQQGPMDGGNSQDAPKEESSPEAETEEFTEEPEESTEA